LNKSLIACNILFALNTENVETAQDEIKLATVGNWKGHQNGPFELNLEDLIQMKTNFDNAKVDIVIDLDHATVIEGTGDAYGWIKSLEIKEAELWGKVEWLDHGKELIKTKKYKYISPVFLPNTIEQLSGQNIGWTLHSAALTNRPFLEDLGEIVANNKNQNEGETGMTKEQEAEMKRLKDENDKLKQDQQKAEDEKIEQEVDDAIAANKVTKDQKESLIALGKGNPEALTSMLAAAKVIVTKPEDDIYANNNNQGGGDIDVLKLGGFNG